MRHSQRWCGALEALSVPHYDLVLLDIKMPGMVGTDVCRCLRERRPEQNLKIIMVSGQATPDDMSQTILGGADDYLAKPFSISQLRRASKPALRLKEAQDRSDWLNQHLMNVNQELEKSLGCRDQELLDARNALVLVLAELVGYRANETGSRLLRLQSYCRALAEEASRMPRFSAAIDANFIDLLECCAPLHDIGKAGLPDHILLKAGKLTPEERTLMQTHTIIGAETLQKAALKHGFAKGFFQIAIDIARHHHERYDGQGYPNRLAGEGIPLAARLVTIADVYDALRSRRVYKPALSHGTAVTMMLEESAGQFDPNLLEVFKRCAPDFERTFQQFAD